jgi:hypothetical protein
METIRNFHFWLAILALTAALAAAFCVQGRLRKRLNGLYRGKKTAPASSPAKRRKALKK